MKVKIIHLLYRATIGGTERTVFNLIREQLMNNYEVICVILQDGGGFVEKYKSLLQENLIALNINTFSGVFGLYKLLKTYDQNWIIHNHVRNLKLGLILKLVTNKKVLTEHILTNQFKEVNPSVYKKLKLFYFLYEKDYTYITSVSTAVKNSLVNNFGIDIEKVKVIFNGIESCQSSIADYNGSFTIGNATHFEKIKNIDLFIAIAERLIEKDKNFKFLLIGDGTHKSRIKNNIQSKKLDKNIILLEPQENLTQFFEQLNLGLITSFSETFSLFAAECLTRGIPVVASAVGGLKEVVEDSNCGYLVNIFDKQDFIEKILKLKNDKNLYRNFSHNARQRAEKFSIENIFYDYHTLYQQILN